jgi:hypothetical protein
MEGGVEDPNPGIVAVPVTLLLDFSCFTSISYLISTDDTYAFLSNVDIFPTGVGLKD